MVVEGIRTASLFHPVRRNSTSKCGASLEKYYAWSSSSDSSPRFDQRTGAAMVVIFDFFNKLNIFLY
jgi:hypothetical protein